MEVVGEAADGIETVKLYEQLTPDLLILDITLPLMDGIECLKEIKARNPKARILVVTMHEDEEYIKQIIHSGASGYVPKSAVDQELFTAISTIMQGYTYLRPKKLNCFYVVSIINRKMKAIPRVPINSLVFVNGKCYAYWYVVIH